MEGFAPKASDEKGSFPTLTRGSLTAQPKRDDIPQYEDLIYLRWQTIVTLCTARDLTYRTDKLVALSGMATAISALFREDQPYHAGIWGGKNFLKFLLWYSSGPGSCDSFEDGEYIVRNVHERMCPFIWSAPSWSWACTIGSVESCSPYEPVQALAEFISCHVIPKGDDIFGQVTGGELVLSGTLFRVHDTDERSGWEAIDGYLDNQPSNNNTGNSPIYVLPILETRDPIFHEGENEPITFAGLFLKLMEERPGGGHAKYERVGAASHSLLYFGAKFLNGEQLAGYAGSTFSL